MDKQPHIPDRQTSTRLLSNLRRTNLEIEEFNLELEKIITKMEQELCQQRLSRVRLKLSTLT